MALLLNRKIAFTDRMNKKEALHKDQRMKIKIVACALASVHAFHSIFTKPIVLCMSHSFLSKQYF